jgi:SAM-dependent methyltransferase
MAERDWYRRIFNEDYLARYAPLLPPERTQREVDGIVRLLALPPGSSVLDLCCGHGRHSIPLALHGYRITGQDLSEPFLARARADAASSGAAVRWVHGDMREIPFDSEFDAVINIFTAFGYLESDTEDQRVLQQVHRALKPGGRFLMEIIHRDNLLKRFSFNGWQRFSDGLLVLEERRFDLLTGRQDVDGLMLYPDGTRAAFAHSLRLYSLSELARMLREAGMEVESAFGGLDGDDLTLESRRMAVLARKPTPSREMRV